jgi:hypothetical protein
MKRRIFKIQRDIGGEMCLVYDKSREYGGQIPMTDELAAMMGDDAKIYVKGHIAEDGLLLINGKTRPQEW